MAQNQSFVGGSSALQVDPNQLQDVLQNVMAKAAQAGSPALDTFTQLQRRRSGRMADLAKALRKQNGKDDPDAAAADSTAAAVAILKTRVDTDRARLKKWPKPRPNEWVVFGTVTDAQGNPAAGLTVRVFDRDRKFDDLLGDTETDESGDFSVIYHERDFKETRENLPDLYVMVSDASGKVLYSSRDNIRYEAGQSEYFTIRLDTKPPKVQRKKTTSTRKS
jgi:5-hydroxyisourate hydrolase-like protein (transthyretin family)